MRRLLGFALAFLTIVVAIGWVNPALAAGEGIISGQVGNKTAGGSPVGVVEVTLTAYVNGKPAADRQKTTTDANGRFEFKGLSTDNGTAYTVSTTFQDAGYTSEPVPLTSDNRSQVVGLDVYDSTTNDENIRISNGHIVVTTDQGALEVLEVWRFTNVGNKTFIGTKGEKFRATLRFTLPQGAFSLSPTEGTTLETTATGAASTAAVPPGVADISFTYFIPFEGSSVTITRKTDYPVASFRLLVQDTGVKVASNTLTPATTQMMNGAYYLNFIASNLAKGVDLDASFSGIVQQSSDPPEASFPWVWLLAGTSLLVMAVFAYPQLKKRQLPAANTTQLLDDEDGLLRELARLDDAYEAGTIEEAKYQARRARAKGRLVDIYAQARRH